MRIYVLQSLTDSTPTVLAVYDSTNKANKARRNFMEDGRFGKEFDDYRIDNFELNNSYLK